MQAGRGSAITLHLCLNSGAHGHRGRPDTRVQASGKPGPSGDKGRVAEEQDILEALAKRGVTTDPLVVPTYVRVTNPADFQVSSMYESVNDPLIQTSGADLRGRLAWQGLGR